MSKGRASTPLRKRRAQAGLSKFKPVRSKQLVQIDQEAVGISTRNWSAVNLCKIEHSETNVNNARSSTEAYIDGFYHKSAFWNQLDRPVKVYEFWLIPKQYNDLATYGDAQLQADLFTVHGQAQQNDRSWTNGYASQIYDEPINAEQYTIIKRKTTMLAPFSSAGGTASSKTFSTGNSYVDSRTYIKLGRKFTYDVTIGEGGSNIHNANPEQPPVFYITYCVPVMEAALTAPIATGIRRNLHVVTYFRDQDSGL